MDSLKKYSPVVLRIGLALVFIWFGISQLTDVVSWTGFVPQSIISLSHLSAATLVHVNGAAEVVLGTMLLLGIWTRGAALLLALHMLDITYIVGFNALGVRDFGLTIAVIAAWMDGDDSLTLDSYIRAAKKPAASSDLNN